MKRLILMATVITAYVAQAKTTEWTGSGGDGEWTTGANWSDGCPAETDTALFPIQVSVKNVPTTFHGIVEDVPYQTALSASADSSYSGHHVERETYVDAFQIVGACPFYLDVVVPRTIGNWGGDRVQSKQEIQRVGDESTLRHLYLAGDDLTILINCGRYITCPDKLTSKSTCFRPHIDDVVSAAYDFLVVLHYHHSIP